MDGVPRAIFDDEHEAFRESVGAFLDKEVVPFHDQWEKDGIVDRDVWAKAGAQGLLGLQLDEEYGGGGTPDFRFNAVIGEEMTRRGVYGAAFTLFNDMIVPYLVAGASEEQKRRWFPGLCSGETIAAIAMSEPAPGSDLQGIRTSAVDAGDHYVLNGQKTFISNGHPRRPGRGGGADRPRRRPSGHLVCSWSSAAWRGSSAAATSTRSVSMPRTPPSCSSPTCACRRRTCWARRAAVSSS